ncbi:MAG: DUF1549 and DUF1553 domain-containing protein [Planctomycetota bacterium]|nr:DUF1549 and DUF1553 domain-containing protein [Planctomycetota bacterium]
MRNQILFLFMAAVWGWSHPGGASLHGADAEPVDFSNDVMAVLSKAGCNQGTCHGNRSGKGGFKLSLRGQDPAFDYVALTRGPRGRRVDRVIPEKSLILLKPAAEVPHEGGRRFRAGDAPFEILRSWIRSGAPGPDSRSAKLERLEVSPGKELEVLVDPAAELRVRVHAVFSDGTRRDVSELAVYEPVGDTVEVSSSGLIRRSSFGESTVLVRYLGRQAPVRVAFVPAGKAYEWRGPLEKNFIDKAIFGKLRRLRLNSSVVCDDTVFLRRATLDLAGRLPTSDEARAFISAEKSGKRARKIDELLVTAGFADFWALKWGDLLRNEEKVLDRKGVQVFQRWIRESIASGKPLDVFAREILTARGSTYRNPPANYLRANRDVLQRAENTAQVFLGVRLACAKCHNHPFERWTQDDYYGWAALFSRVRYKVFENKRRDGLDKNAFVGEQVVWIAREGELKDPRDGKRVAPLLLGAAAGGPGEKDDPLEFLADWVTSRENPFFSRSLVNRIWFNLMGKGLVDPVDDFRATNPPSHPELLERLARELEEGGFELRKVIRLIMNSSAYQLSSVPVDSNGKVETGFARVLPRRLDAEQLVDGLAQVIGVSPSFNGYPRGIRAVQLPGTNAILPRYKKPSSADVFLKLFGKPDRMLTCECERMSQTHLAQAFHLVSGPMLHDMISSGDNRLGVLADSGLGEMELISELYWSALGRPPSEIEVVSARRLFSSAGGGRAALEDLAWALVNSKEFLLRR